MRKITDELTKKVDKILSVLESCETLEQLSNCYSWGEKILKQLKDFYKEDMSVFDKIEFENNIFEPKYKLLASRCTEKLKNITNNENSEINEQIEFYQNLINFSENKIKELENGI